MLKCYLLSFLMTTIVFSCLIIEVKSKEYKEYNAYNECHEEFKYGEFPFGLFGSIDFGCSSTRCQCYQHKLPIVMYSTIL